MGGAGALADDRAMVMTSGNAGSPTSSRSERPTRLATIQHTAGYLAAAAMLAYLAVKLVWIVRAAGFGDTPDGWDAPGWTALNLVTIGMAGTGALLGLSIARDWHRLLPGRLLAAVAWLVAGFLVSLLPYLVLQPFLDAAKPTEQSSPSAMPGWETTLLSFGFLGTAAGVAVGLPIYVWRRWLANTARTVDGGSPRPADFAGAGGALLAGVLGGWWLAWSVGGGLGSHLHGAPAGARVLEGTLGVWALAAGGAVLWWHGRAAHRMAALAVAFVGSGSLFAWSAWRLPFDLLQPAGFEPVAETPLAVSHHVAGVVAALLLLRRLATLTPRPQTDKERP